MPTVPWFQPVLPNKKPIIKTVNPSINAMLRDQLSKCGFELWREAATYEAPPSPKYRRTLTLSKSWSMVGPKWEGSNLVVIVRSSGNVAPYNYLVRGPMEGDRRQAKRMHQRGWRSVTEIKNQIWPKYRTRIRTILKGS
jgi:hypothetical protein